MKLRRHIPKLVALALSWLLAGYIAYVYAQTALSTMYIMGGPYPGAPAYTVWVEGSTYYAKDMVGQIDFSGTNCSDVIGDSLAAGTGEIHLEKGTFSIANYLPLGENDSLTGEGSSTILYLADTSDCDMVYAANVSFVKVSEIRFDQNRAGQTFNDHSAIQLANVNFSVVENCYFENIRYRAINLAQATNNYHNIIRNNFFSYLCNNAIAVQGSYNLIEGNKAYYVNSYAYYARSSVYGNTWIANSAFYNDTFGSPGPGESIGMGIGESSLYAYNQTVIGGEFGFLDTDGMNIYHGEGSIISNVRSHHNGRYGFTIGCDNVTLIGCYGWENTDNGLILQGGATSDAHIESCVFNENGADGIHIGSSETYVMISGTTCYRNSGNGIEVYGNYTMISNCQALDNTGYGFIIRTGKSYNVISCSRAFSNGWQIIVQPGGSNNYVNLCWNSTTWVDVYP